MRVTPEQYAGFLKRNAGGASRGTLPAAPKKSKFKNIRCRSHDGKNFASKLERDYYEQLLLRWKAGEVLWFVLQPSFSLEGGVKYIADFLVVEKPLTSPVVIDCKGFQTADSKIKLKQMKARYGIDVQLVHEVKIA